MKKYFLISTALLIGMVFFSSCKKKGCTDSTACNYNAEAKKDDGTCIIKASCNLNDPPSSFTKKVLLEECTGTWCPYCTDGISRVHELHATHGDNLIVAAIHVSSDPMKIDAGQDIRDFFEPSGTPSGLVDRVPYSNGDVNMNRGYWSNMVSQRISETPPCGLAIDAGTSGSVVIQTAFNADVSGDVRICAYLIEEDVTGDSQYDQKNNSNSTPGHEFEGAGSPIAGYAHEHVLRAVLSGGEPNEGDAITVSTTDVVNMTYTYDLTGFNSEKCYIIAFVQVLGVDHGHSSDYQKYEVLNVQKVKVGEVQQYD